MNGLYGYSLGFSHFFMIIIWVAILVGIVWLLLSAKSYHSNASETPLDIAKKRYAKGEITKEELDEIKRNL
ncbi:SHOCT domain-containing protein [Shewanella yunxiaonensis]|uniref:SHOCT domain-containing protein n=1 Tax=Shewanella yunxiaonensis TaxID=2829809 RepID=A0ABX7YTA0_9GAMM|nr:MULTISPECIES: SHOCT domain-containing protein [Shewanella]MDF0536038.1 SHOCT domain-containing protein [Shewanella sp. A32]QUN05551.1 SHOCT domain-containing protein [Shewanella yunxiaonensis]